MDTESSQMDVDDQRVWSGDINPTDFQPIVVEPMETAVTAFDQSGPRLMISHITNENFKSYAGTQVLGPFHKSFSSIVGPNGSGKSNVIDSMLFVFGYRANKIRSKKISVLLHNSENHKNINSCTVSVHFQQITDTGSGDDGYEVIPGSKFVVSRTAYRDNSSTYTVDGRKVTYKEVATLLRKSGIDLDHNRFLILQGEVEQIAMMKPKAQSEHDEGMLEFLEDIIGSSRFKEPIDVLEKRVERLTELRAEKLHRVKAVEKEKDELEGTKNEALEYLTMENDINRKNNWLYQTYVYDFATNEKKASEKLSEIKSSMSEVNAKLEEFSAAKKEKTTMYKQIHKKYEELATSCEQKKERFSELEQQDLKVGADIKHGSTKAKKLAKTLEHENKKLEDLKLVPAKSESELAELRVKLEKLEQNKEQEETALAKVMEGLKTATQGLQDKKEKEEEKLLVLKKTVNETKSKYDVAQSELDIYQSNEKNETAKLREAERNLTNVTETLKERKEEIDRLKKTIPEAENCLTQARKDSIEAEKAEEKLSNQVKTTRLKVEEGRSSMAASRNRGHVVKAIMELKSSGRMPGVFGRLGDLGAIDDKYDVAVSTACGPLDNILVDTLTTAEKCVQFLRTNDIGRATFMCLDKYGHFKEAAAKKINAPENVPRLFDLIKAKKDEYKPAFYFALRDTLVADNIDQAQRIAYGRVRHRVVTLKGELIDLVGTMSGGGGPVKKGRMGSSVVSDIDSKDLDKMEQSLQKMGQSVHASRESKVRLEETIEKLTKELQEMKHTLAKHEMDIKALAEQDVSLEQQIKEQKVKVKAAAPDQGQLDRLGVTVEGYKTEYEKAAAAAGKVEASVQKLHKEIMETGGSKLRAAQDKVSKVNEQCDQVTGNITKVGVSIKTAQRNTKKAENKIASVESEIAENDTANEELQKQFTQIEQEATELMSAHEEAQIQLQDVEEQLLVIQKEKEEIEAHENELKKSQIEVKHEVENYEGIITDNNRKIKHWKKELGKLKMHAIERDEPPELTTFPDEEVAGVDKAQKESVQYEVTVLEEKIQHMKPNLAAIAEFRRKEELYLKRVGELDQITDLRDQQRKNHEELRKQRLDEFMSGFSVITNKLKEMYQMITLGGDAELELVDSLDPFSEGIVFSVRPPKKSWKNISNLSGGEKTLSSLALVFALHHYKPTPLYVMDEIDAALDFKNVSIVANYIKDRTKNAQFIIISLRNNMFELADRLIGIYKTDNCTKSVTINPNKLSVPLGDVTNTEGKVDAK